MHALGDELLLAGFIEIVDFARVVAIELARQAGAALVDENDVACGAQLAQARFEQAQDVAAGLARAARQHEHRIGPRPFAQGRRQRDMQSHFGAVRVVVIERDVDFGAAQGLIVARQVAHPSDLERVDRRSKRFTGRYSAKKQGGGKQRRQAPAEDCFRTRNSH